MSQGTTEVDIEISTQARKLAKAYSAADWTDSVPGGKSMEERKSKVIEDFLDKETNSIMRDKIFHEVKETLLRDDAEASGRLAREFGRNSETLKTAVAIQGTLEKNPGAPNLPTVPQSRNLNRSMEPRSQQL